MSMSFDNDLENSMVVDRLWRANDQDQAQWEQDWTFLCETCEGRFHKDASNNFHPDESSYYCDECFDIEKERRQREGE